MVTFFIFQLELANSFSLFTLYNSSVLRKKWREYERHFLHAGISHHVGWNRSNTQRCYETAGISCSTLMMPPNRRPLPFYHYRITKLQSRGHKLHRAKENVPGFCPSSMKHRELRRSPGRFLRNYAREFIPVLMESHCRSGATTALFIAEAGERAGPDEISLTWNRFREFVSRNSDR